ncbi:MAG: two-component system, sensor histidine kinase and response regulator, partial [Actinomycetota bacterium]|nr:two-component system, sensor histidine kinase and response regulator [Actinomycetota bacterium]
PGGPVLLRFSVTDTGIGVPPDKLGSLFEKFTQVDASTTRQYGGTGLGLAISKQLAELMGGTIGVLSEPGRGSEFWFTTRLERQEGPEPEESSRALAGVRVLVVDDNVTSREILTTRLSAWGMRCSEAEDGPQALGMMHRAVGEDDPFEIAVIDMQMPGMDGEALGRVIKDDERLAPTRLAILTSLGRREDAAHFREIGFSVYATKPIRTEELRTMLGSVLADSGQAMLQGLRDDGAGGPDGKASADPAAVLRMPDGRPARILLVEDNVVNQQLTLMILKKQNPDVVVDIAGNGLEALAAVKDTAYDLLLMDVQMPEMDGLAATKELRRPGSPARDTPIIAMTAHAMQGDRERCLGAGMNGYVSKPVSSPALMEAISFWLGRAGIAGETGGTVPGDSASGGPGSCGAEVWDRRDLEERLGDEEMVSLIVDSFLADVPAQVEDLLACLGTGDVEGAGRRAHTVSGVAGNVGARTLQSLAQAAERAAREGDLDALERCAEEVDHALAAVLRAMGAKRR